MNQVPYICGVLTLSDKGSRGERQDTAGPLLKEMLVAQGFTLAAYKIIPDCEELIVSTLMEWADKKQLDLIVTTGGTGVSPSDHTPEATRRVIEREVPGLGEAMRQASLAKTVQAVWSRGIAGIRGQCLIINLPGSERAAKENLHAVLSALEHGIRKIKGDATDCGG
ncbi:MAG: molybdopterin adenylyltransferase [Candidatus Electronema aureum]|uniref:Molybdopterin adenylyltransferase n=1 Tax=Candidatus Electronema aureum TaxID=2005002 RepID=A0A521FZJ1_9BACT|nr:MAG: molybdopterin adenylyltransferase [Candidatus Electronema aureum]